MDDTFKQIESTSNALKHQINLYKYGSYDAIIKRKIYGIQAIQNIITLTETSIMNPAKRRFLATIPTEWAMRYQMLKVFELIAMLYNDITQELVLEQTNVTWFLEMEANGIVEVDQFKTVACRLYSSNDDTTDNDKNQQQQ
ncbi:hypothetical protein INT45_012052 [Circinella minor]|uniref:Uncharacterized protein n=1 Tax=Circinella minor TaxID=1195481 RepID=A0A8H7SH57_9FUNG|nr:hypothetical protein INT45_012052 [Circinella minor]